MPWLQHAEQATGAKVCLAFPSKMFKLTGQAATMPQHLYQVPLQQSWAFVPKYTGGMEQEYLE